MRGLFCWNFAPFPCLYQTFCFTLPFAWAVSVIIAVRESIPIADLIRDRVASPLDQIAYNAPIALSRSVCSFRIASLDCGMSPTTSVVVNLWPQASHFLRLITWVSRLRELVTLVVGFWQIGQFTVPSRFGLR